MTAVALRERVEERQRQGRGVTHGEAQPAHPVAAAAPGRRSRRGLGVEDDGEVGGVHDVSSGESPPLQGRLQRTPGQPYLPSGSDDEDDAGTLGPWWRCWRWCWCWRGCCRLVAPLLLPLPLPLPLPLLEAPGRRLARVGGAAAGPHGVEQPQRVLERPPWQHAATAAPYTAWAGLSRLPLLLARPSGGSCFTLLAAISASASASTASALSGLRRPPGRDVDGHSRGAGTRPSPACASRCCSMRRAARSQACHRRVRSCTAWCIADTISRWAASTVVVVVVVEGEDDDEPRLLAPVPDSVVVREVLLHVAPRRCCFEGDEAAGALQEGTM